MRHSSRMSLEKFRRSVAALQLSQTDEQPTISYDYDEKAAYEQRRRERRSKHGKHNSYDSKSSVSSSTASFDDEKHDEDSVPRYAHAFYNRIDDKPLPLLPGSQTRRVRFVPRTNVVDKPLPPLPQEIQHRNRTTSCDGEHAWWSKRFEMTDVDDENLLAQEKDMLY